MILVLENADFSANNIGHVEFNVELSQETLAIMDNATKYPKDKENDYAQALNTLVNGLVNAGIYSKISTLVIPVMSSTIDECSKNQKSGVDCRIPATFKNLFGLKADGTLYRKQFNYTNTNDQCGYVIDNAYNNLCMFGYYKAGETKVDALIGANSSGYYSNKNYINYRTTNGSTMIAGKDGAVTDTPGNALIRHTAITSAFVANYAADGGCFKDNVNLYEGSYYNVPAEVGTLVTFFPLVVGAINAESNGSMLIYGCGTALTTAEVNTLYDLIDEFGSHFI